MNVRCRVTDENKNDLKELERRANLEKRTLNRNGCKVLSLSLETTINTCFPCDGASSLFSSYAVGGPGGFFDCKFNMNPQSDHKHNVNRRLESTPVCTGAGGGRREISLSASRVQLEENPSPDGIFPPSFKAEAASLYNIWTSTEGGHLPK